ncbi:MAG: FAD-binding domain-containing protein [Oscillatoria sp. PMC 1068.18]|nr:FAD-binding domain-containing protein [Oscillatoria sp. PMC 1076.18]MEC4988590.1 FAD-binding domain-containing protein [Oscillatoria sp. PMC 1068.18]
MSELILFWHRRDLRITDNLGLAAARKETNKIVGVFCFDPGILEADDVAPARVKYLVGCLSELQASYQQAGSELLILQGKPSQEIPKLAVAVSAKAVYWNWDVEPYAKKRDRQVREALKEKGIAVENFWDQLLHPPGAILTKSGNDPYKVYTPFWKNWQSHHKEAPAQKLADVKGLSEKERKKIEARSLPSAKDLGYVWDNELLLQPGEKAAQTRLEEFCDKLIGEYQQQRDIPALDGTSKLSAALKFGAIGIRTVWEAAAAAYSNSRSEETEANIQTWQKELAWREFYQQALYFFPQLAEGPYREYWEDFPWDNSETHFQAWCEGKTGYPIVDAAMRQLNTVGWMHNRCRMIVASFLTKDLMIDWQWGEKYFMQRLFDGDLASNNGGWQWSASSGMDPKPLRIFNPYSQTQKYDPEAEYIRQWLPEISSVDTECLVSGKITEADCDRCGYPQPIVNHKKQRKEFKQRYQQLKDS